MRDERDVAYQRLLKVCQSGLVSITDFRYTLKRLLLTLLATDAGLTTTAQNLPGCRHNPLNIFAAHEISAFADFSMATKMTVHLTADCFALPFIKIMHSEVAVLTRCIIIYSEVSFRRLFWY